jgi:hypothetical protein
MPDTLDRATTQVDYMDLLVFAPNVAYPIRCIPDIHRHMGSESTKPREVRIAASAGIWHSLVEICL